MCRLQSLYTYIVQMTSDLAFCDILLFAEETGGGLRVRVAFFGVTLLGLIRAATRSGFYHFTTALTVLRVYVYGIYAGVYQ